MSSKQPDVAKSNISPVLFMTVDGEPMSFFLRPGRVKCNLQPLITAGGGLLCNVQQPGAILLIDAEERDSVPDTTAHWYVSNQYIHDCVEKNEQLDLEDYRLNPEAAQRHSARLNNSKEGSPGISGGRIAYSPEDDAAILSYVSKHKTEIGGNRLWQEMEKQRVTSHSWQSMKYRYRARLAQKQSEVEEINAAKEDSNAKQKEPKDEENSETHIHKPSCEEDVGPPQSPATTSLQMVSADTDLTQIYVLPIQAGNMTENLVSQTLSSPHGEVQQVNPQIESQTADSPRVESQETETPDSPQTEGPVDSTEPDNTEQKTTMSPQNVSMPEDLLQSVTEPSSPIKRKVKQKASGKLEQPQCPKTRRQLEREILSSPEPYGKKLRSSSTTAEKTSTPPRPLKKKKSAVNSALQKDTTDQPSCKRARGKTVAAVAESHQEESEEAIVSETPQPVCFLDEETNSLVQKGNKKKEKRKLGILELATKEFESESEPEEDEAPAQQNPAETLTIQSTSREPPLQPMSTQANSDPGPSLQVNGQEAQTSSLSHIAATGSPRSLAAEAVQIASRAHLFIFDSESQEEDSQSLVGDSTAAAAGDIDTTHSLTQVQLEEDKQRIRDLMKQTNQDLDSVTKALLKTSGDFSTALNLLLNPCSFSGPFWTRCDDSLLLSADPDARQQLQEKYGEVDLAKRIAFFEVEG
ncbi:telomeric repeat-binding factor 2-interacting protein 1 isoform X1 [Channa argus]|uniref:telomeric repeat-binding factor 2-interacting protein 1 isoform X1 n=1 Tax=Channa argus TaxID=215402 RepID=UPI0029455AFA|nr:hypothetical protein Q8A73_005816 [Channa argus]